MKINYSTFAYSFLFFLIFSICSFGQINSIWTKISKEKASSGEVLFRNSEPVKATHYELNFTALKDVLRSTPNRKSGVVSDVIVSFPNSDGSFDSYRVLEAPVMQAELQEKYPNIRSYVGQGIENSADIIRFSLTPQGLHTMKFSAQGGVEIIDPVSRNFDSYMVYRKQDLPTFMDGFECGFVNEISDSNGDSENYSQRNANDGNMREYRLALASTIEYSQFHWEAAGLTPGDTEAAKKAAVLAEMVVLMTRVNGIYERDLSITMTLISNNEDIIFIYYFS